MDNPLDYPAEVWRLFLSVPRAGRFVPSRSGDIAAEIGTVAGKSRLRLECRTEKGTITDSRFQAYGCPFTVATGAWIAAWLIGRPLADLASPPVKALRSALEIPEDRAHCWLMAQDVLRELVLQAP